MKISNNFSVADDWTMEPGWSQVERKYNPLDCERWIRQNGIREAGRANGEQEFPPSEAVQPDDMYEKILDLVNQRGRQCHAQVSEFLVQQRYNLEQEVKEGMAPIRYKVEGFRDQAKVDLRNKGEEDQAILAKAERNAHTSWAALEAFRKKGNLHRVAQYNEIDTWYWWLISVVVIEALANAMMLAGVLEYGLLGAVFIMLAIGVVNVGLMGCVIGEGWRQKNAAGVLRAAFGWLLVAVGAAGMLAWNLLVGHFRDSMLAIATKAEVSTSSLEDLLTDDTIERFLASPMGLEGMQSWILAVIGAGCCILAATKWLKRDDVYPGYGTVHRAATEHNEEYLREVSNRRNDLKNLYERHVEQIRDERQKVENKKGNHQLISDTAKDVVRQFPMQLSQYQNHLDFIIAAYRSENEKARSTPSPKFFAEKLLIDQKMLEAPKWEGISASDYDEDWEGFQHAEDEVRNEFLAAQKRYPTIEDLKEGERERERLKS